MTLRSPGVGALLLVAACRAPVVGDTAGPAATTDTSDTSDTSDTFDTSDVSVTEHRLRASHEEEEGLNLVDGEVVVLGANNETEPEAEHADVHATLGRFIGLATYTEAGAAGRLCVVGTGFATIAEVPTEGVCGEGDWAGNLNCAVNSAGSEPMCAGTGLLVTPRGGGAPFRARVVTDDMVADGDYLAGITLEVQEIRAE